MYSPTEDFVTHLRGSIKPAKHESKYNGKSQSWVMTNVPAFKIEPSMPDKDAYLSRVEFATRLNSWLKIYSHVVNEESFDVIVRKHNYLKEIVDELTAGLLDPRQKIKVISDYLKKAIQWNDELAFYGDRKSTRLNSSHQIISYAVFCLKKKTN